MQAKDLIPNFAIYILGISLKANIWIGCVVHVASVISIFSVYVHLDPMKLLIWRLTHVCRHVIRLTYVHAAHILNSHICSVINVLFDHLKMVLQMSALMYFR